MGIRIRDREEGEEKTGIRIPIAFLLFLACREREKVAGRRIGVRRILGGAFSSSREWRKVVHLLNLAGQRIGN